MLGVISNLRAYLPVFFLVELFRRTSSRTSKIKRLQKSISTISTTKKVNLLPMNGSKKNIQFPWWLKVILYLVSFSCMALSICLIAFKGILFLIGVLNDLDGFFNLFLKYVFKELNSEMIKLKIGSYR